MQAWVANPALKAVGLGHEGTGATLIEFVPDYGGGTSTAVGSFLAQQITWLDRQRRAAIAAQERLLHWKSRTAASGRPVANADGHAASAVNRAPEAVKKSRNCLLTIGAYVVGFLLFLAFTIGCRFGH